MAGYPDVILTYSREPARKFVLSCSRSDGFGRGRGAACPARLFDDFSWRLTPCSAPAAELDKPKQHDTGLPCAAGQEALLDMMSGEPIP